MPKQTFPSFEAFIEANRHARLRQMVLGRDRGNWVLTHLMVNNLSVQWGEAGGKAVIEGASRPGGLTIFLQTRGAPAFSGNGRRFDDLSLMVAEPNDEFCLAADGGSRRWCSLYIPNGDLVGPSGDTTNRVGSMRGVFQLPPQRMERFRLVIEQLDEAVQQAPAVPVRIWRMGWTVAQEAPRVWPVGAHARVRDQSYGRGHEGNAQVA
jgi:hypothetical protein